MAWRDSSYEAQTFKQLLIEFLLDVGGFLSLPLYYEGITCLLGGPERIIGAINVVGKSESSASQKCHLLTPTSAFKITAWTKPLAINGYRTQLIKFLNHTELNEIAWVNLNHNNVVFETISASHQNST